MMDIPYDWKKLRLAPDSTEPFVKVMPLGAESEMSGFLNSNHLSGYDGMQIYITGNENRIQLSSVFVNQSSLWLMAK